MGFWTGQSAKWDQRSNLSPSQQSLQQQAQNAAMGSGAGGAFGGAADYYRDLLGGNQNYNAMAAPEMRQFNEETMPGIAEQFAGMGSGGSFGSRFASEQSSAGAGLAERLAAMRAGLRQQGAQGLMGVGQQGLNQHMQNMYMPRQPGFAESMGGAIGQGMGSFFGGGLGSMGVNVGNSLFNSFRDRNNGLGDTIKPLKPGGINQTYNPYTGVQQ